MSQSIYIYILQVYITYRTYSTMLECRLYTTVDIDMYIDIYILTTQHDILRIYIYKIITYLTRSIKCDTILYHRTTCINVS